MQTFLIIFLAVLTLISVSLQRTYASVPLKQLKHRTRNGDDIAKALLKAVHFGYSLRAVLWFLIGVTGAGFFVMVSQTSPIWVALVSSGILIWLGFVWIPASRVTIVSEKLASWCAPVLAKLLNYLSPIIDKLVLFIRKHRPVRFHTGLYDRFDLINLLEQQLVQPDNRIEKTELDIALHALTFGDDTIGMHMTPKRVVKQVSADEPLGPVIMDELHASGYSRFPVYEDKKDNIVGTLHLRDLINSSHSGNVSKLTAKGAAYIHEDQSLHDALQAILRTHQHLFIVVNSFEEFVGIITIEDILETILGSPIIDEFDRYDDLRAVAARAARKDHVSHTKKTDELETTTPESPEVVE